jgi:hypothetical protein
VRGLSLKQVTYEPRQRKWCKKVATSGVTRT